MMHAGGKNVVISKFDSKITAKMIDQLKGIAIGDFPPIGLWGGRLRGS
jgi:hypothetical protein